MHRHQRRMSFTAEAQSAQSKTRQEKSLRISANLCESLRSLRLCGEGYLFLLAS